MEGVAIGKIPGRQTARPTMKDIHPTAVSLHTLHNYLCAMYHGKNCRAETYTKRKMGKGNCNWPSAWSS